MSAFSLDQETMFCKATVVTQRAALLPFIKDPIMGSASTTSYNMSIHSTIITSSLQLTPTATSVSPGPEASGQSILLLMK